MAISWTPEQSSAINTRDKTLLVSAAAGSGKTATLARRIIDSLIDKDAPADISRMLIVTFTRASAGDLREKISKELSQALLENPSDQHLTSQLVALGSAHISTIDSFYYEIVKSHFQRLSLAQIPRIADDAEIAPLNRSVMDEVIDQFYFTHEGFERFIEHFSDARKSDAVADIFLDMYDKLLSQRKGVDTLKDYESELLEAAESDFLKTKFGAVAVRELEAFLGYTSGFSSDAIELINTDADAQATLFNAFSDDLTLWQTIGGYLKARDYEKVQSLIIKPPYSRLGSYKGGNGEIKALKEKRDDIKDRLKKLAGKYFKYSQNEISSSFMENAKICGELHILLSEFNARLMQEKAVRGSFTFSDIRRFVLELLCDGDGNPTDIALEYRDRFDYIYVDEYQDVDDVQDSIFSAIASPTNRFMVGDIKQSIYSFRGANPSIFAAYKESMPALGEKDSDRYSIFMSNNFRCDETVVDFSNAVSSFLFSNRSQSIGYSKKDDLIFTKPYDDPMHKPVPVTVAITGVLPDGVTSSSLTPAEKDENLKCGAKYIAQEIRNLVDSGHLAKVKDENGDLTERKIEYKDIAVLARGRSGFDMLEKEFAKLGIPSQSSVESDFFENPDVLLMLALLSTIDNPQKDVSLAGTLRSPLYGFSLDDIMEIRMAADRSYSLYDALLQYSETDTALGRKCRDFNKELEYWRNAAMMSPCDKLIKKLYREMSVLSYATDGNQNLLKLYEYAIKFEASGFKGLYGFIKYVNELIECGIKMSESKGNSNDNCVKLMTIHQSKGLEFPVCFVYQCEKSFNTQFKKNKIQFEPSLGISFVQHDENGLVKFDTPLLRSIIDTISVLQAEEEMRLLYVAMTRARERLYMVANIPNPNKKTANTAELCKYDKSYAILCSSSYIEWILLSLPYTEKQNCFKTVYIGTDMTIISEQGGTPDEKSEQDAALADPVLVKLLRERFDYKYPFEHISDLPAKLSVSALSPQVLDLSDERSANQAQMDGSFEEQFGKDFAIPERLNEEKGASAAERGTATHAFLQFCDFENAVKNGIEEEIGRLCEKKFIAPKFADIINKKQLKAFFESALYKRIASAKHIWREQRFNIFLPASEFTQNAEKAAHLKNETIAVQGVIDIFFEDSDGKIILCDYKTDYLTREEISNPSLAAEKLNKRHAEQLSYYAKAIKEMLGRAPDEIIIYSLPLEDNIKVEF